MKTSAVGRDAARRPSNPNRTTPTENRIRLRGFRVSGAGPRNLNHYALIVREIIATSRRLRRGNWSDASRRAGTPLSAAFRRDLPLVRLERNLKEEWLRFRFRNV